MKVLLFLLLLDIEKKELEIGHAQQADSMEEEVPEDAQGMNMTM